MQENKYEQIMQNQISHYRECEKLPEKKDQKTAWKPPGQPL